MFAQLVISLNLVLAGLRLSLKNRQVGAKNYGLIISNKSSGVVFNCA
jgi:hypothetical protein